MGLEAYQVFGFSIHGEQFDASLKQPWNHGADIVPVVPRPSQQQKTISCLA